MENKIIKVELYARINTNIKKEEKGQTNKLSEINMELVKLNNIDSIMRSSL